MNTYTGFENLPEIPHGWVLVAHRQGDRPFWKGIAMFPRIEAWRAKKIADEKTYVRSDPGMVFPHTHNGIILSPDHSVLYRGVCQKKKEEKVD